MKETYRVTHADQTISLTIDVDESEMMDQFIKAEKADIEDHFGREIDSMTLGQAYLSHTSSETIDLAEAGIGVSSNFDLIQSGEAQFSDGSKALVNFNTVVNGLAMIVNSTDSNEAVVGGISSVNEVHGHCDVATFEKHRASVRV